MATQTRALRNARAKAIIARLRTDPNAGAQGAGVLNELIDDPTTEDRPRSQIVEEMAEAAGIDASTVNDILNANINCPPIARLEGFAEALDVGLDVIRSAFEGDGCDYGGDDED